MANWCLNTVQFECGTDTMTEIAQFFYAMSEKEDREKQGQMPDFITEERGHFFEILWEESNLLSYLTKWSPNTEILQMVADLFKTDFTHSYQELGCCVYGEATYKEGVLTDVFLEYEDFKSYEYDDDTNEYTFEGVTYDNDYDILEILLERKKNKNHEPDNK